MLPHERRPTAVGDDVVARQALVVVLGQAQRVLGLGDGGARVEEVAHDLALRQPDLRTAVGSSGGCTLSASRATARPAALIPSMRAHHVAEPDADRCVAVVGVQLDDPRVGDGRPLARERRAALELAERRRREVHVAGQQRVPVARAGAGVERHRARRAPREGAERVERDGEVVPCDPEVVGDAAAPGGQRRVVELEPASPHPLEVGIDRPRPDVVAVGGVGRGGQRPSDLALVAIDRDVAHGQERRRLRDHRPDIHSHTPRCCCDVVASRMVRDRSKSSNVLFELWRLSRAAGALLSDQLAGAGVTGDEFGIYSVLATVEHMTPSALARWMSAPATTVSSHVKRLEARGHVSRRPDPADGRSSLLRLTAAGRRTWERATAGYLPILAGVEERLGAAEPEVRAALITLRAAIDATDR